MIAQALGPAGSPAQYLIAQSYLESLGQIAKDADKLVFMPYEAARCHGVARRHPGAAQAQRPRATERSRDGASPSTSHART